MAKMSSALLGIAFVAAVALGVKTMMFGQVRTEKLPAPLLDEPQAAGHTETAVFAGGCFWGVQTTFERIKGVEKTWAGYSGGTKETANYGAVSSETTGHAESVKVVFDPAKISYGTLLRVFFSVVHDPTQMNRQGTGCGDFVPVGDLLIRRRSRRRLRMRTSRSWMRRRRFRRRS